MTLLDALAQSWALCAMVTVDVLLLAAAVWYVARSNGRT